MIHHGDTEARSSEFTLGFVRSLMQAINPLAPSELPAGSVGGFWSRSVPGVKWMIPHLRSLARTGEIVLGESTLKPIGITPDDEYLIADSHMTTKGDRYTFANTSKFPYPDEATELLLKGDWAEFGTEKYSLAVHMGGPVTRLPQLLEQPDGSIALVFQRPLSLVVARKGLKRFLGAIRFTVTGITITDTGGTIHTTGMRGYLVPDLKWE